MSLSFWRPITIVPVSAKVLPNVAPETPRSMNFGSVMRTRVRASSLPDFLADGGGIVAATGRSEETRQPMRPNSTRSPGFSGISCVICRPLSTVGAVPSSDRNVVCAPRVSISQ